MAYCGPKGIPLHEFLAWPQESQQAALMWQAHEARRCPDCRTHREEWFDEDGKPTRPQHWHQEVCPGCQAKQRAAADAEKDEDGTKGTVLVAADGPEHLCPSCRRTPIN